MVVSDGLGGVSMEGHTTSAGNDPLTATSIRMDSLSDAGAVAPGFLLGRDDARPRVESQTIEY